MTAEELTRRYMSLYHRGQKLFDEYQPCRDGDNPCRLGGFCCDGCKYLTAEGCSTKALWCKLWICGMVARTAPQAFITKLRALQLEMLNNVTRMQGRFSLEDLIQRSNLENAVKETKRPRKHAVRTGGNNGN